jgi:hypothetical protein
VQQVIRVIILEKRITRLTLQHTDLELELAEHMPNGHFDSDSLNLEHPRIGDYDSGNESSMGEHREVEAEEDRTEGGQDGTEEETGEGVTRRGRMTMTVPKMTLTILNRSTMILPQESCLRNQNWKMSVLLLVHESWKP